jgi:aspartate ammonia-lyase
VMVRRSVGLVTALNPYIGYENATSVAQEALRTGKDISTIVLERGLMTAGALAQALRLEALVGSRDTVQEP